MQRTEKVVRTVLSVTLIAKDELTSFSNCVITVERRPSVQSNAIGNAYQNLHALYGLVPEASLPAKCRSLRRIGHLFQLIEDTLSKHANRRRTSLSNSVVRNAWRDVKQERST